MVKGSNRDYKTFRIEIRGLVQGIGFRPFIYRLARQHNLKGWVENRNDGVQIKINTSDEGAERFKNVILDEAPEASDIESIIITEVKPAIFNEFIISSSSDISDAVTEISPDIAVCPDCLKDMANQPHRIDYPFINCTHCGPRFSIIQNLPYDRPNTTMNAFEMCPVCRKEYENIEDRRFHAQPVACNQCGPSYTLHKGDNTITSLKEILKQVRTGLTKDKIFALKGMGGFHLMCDAFNETAVKKLREIKKRDGKPLALMFRSIEEAKEFVFIGKEEENLLVSWRRPIVLLKRRGDITTGIADGLNSLGIMLPYMPFHFLLFREIETSGVVLTSGNFSDEPILISNEEAIKQFGSHVDGIITYNRDIHNRNDDSVAIVMDNDPSVIRRSRGYAPSPIRTRLETEGVFAAGAELVNAFCMGKGRNAFMSQYTGDLKNAETLQFYEEIYDRFSRMFRFRPEIVTHDLHPDYLSTKFAKKLAEDDKSIFLLPVQHHFAHIASVMLDRGLDGEVIGISFDGMGLGNDGHIWGSETMIASYSEYKRMYHFEYVPLPGGDKANKEPWRMALSYLYKYYGEGFIDLPLPVLKEIDSSMITNLKVMIDRSINTPLISSAGRLFDMVSALLGLNYMATYQAEAPMLLESIADSNEKGSYPFDISGEEILFQPMVRKIVRDVSEGRSKRMISGKFHNTISDVVVEMALRIRRLYQLNRVVLSGGTFQNRILTEKLLTGLPKEGFDVYLPVNVPVNDQGIALGQLAIGAARKES